MTRKKVEIDHPSHYTRSKYEVWDVIIAWGLNYCLGATIKHIARAGHKRGHTALNDLKKARNYLDKEIQEREKE